MRFGNPAIIANATHGFRKVEIVPHVAPPPPAPVPEVKVAKPATKKKPAKKPTK